MDALQLEIAGQIHSIQTKQTNMSDTMLNSHHDSLETMETRAARYIACDMHAHHVSKAGSLISG